MLALYSHFGRCYIQKGPNTLRIKRKKKLGCNYVVGGTVFKLLHLTSSARQANLKYIRYLHVRCCLHGRNDPDGKGNWNSLCHHSMWINGFFKIWFNGRYFGVSALMTLGWIPGCLLSEPESRAKPMNPKLSTLWKKKKSQKWLSSLLRAGKEAHPIPDSTMTLI